MRSFIALELPKEAKAAAVEVISRLQSSGADVKWVRPELMHLTLKFLGEIEAGQVDAIAKALESACGGVPPLALALEGVGSFPARGRPQVVWLGFSGRVEQLVNLSKRVYSELDGLGFPPETRPFRPHLTLGRLRRRKKGAKKGGAGDVLGTAGLSREIAGLAGYRGPEFVADRVVLMKSTLTPRGPLYNRLHEFELKG